MSAGRFVVDHGVHAVEVGAPAAWMAWVIVRERRRHPVPGRSSAPERPAPDLVGALATAVVVLGCLGAASIHASIAPKHYREGLIYGLFFTGLSVGQLLLGGLIAWKRDPRVITVVAAGNAATIGLWLLTRLVAIPAGPQSGLRESFGGVDILASALEAVTVVAALILLHRSGIAVPRPGRPRRRRAPVGAGR